MDALGGKLNDEAIVDDVVGEYFSEGAVASIIVGVEDETRWPVPVDAKGRKLSDVPSDVGEYLDEIAVVVSMIVCVEGGG